METSCKTCIHEEVCSLWRREECQDASCFQLDGCDYYREAAARWILVTERLPECEVGAEIRNVEWISHDIVFAGCFGRGGKYRDAYFRTWTDATEGIDAKDADYWRAITLPEPPEGEDDAEVH